MSDRNWNPVRQKSESLSDIARNTQEERVVQKEEHPLLSCKDIEVLLATFLPRRDVDQAEVLMQMRQRHHLRQRAIESHARAQKRREKEDG